MSRSDLNRTGNDLLECLKLFELPRVLGNYMNEEISVGAGRYGPYIKYGEKKFVSIPRTEDPLKISMERAKELINEKEKAEAPVGTYKGLPIQKGKGRFGPFLKWNNLFVNIPRRFDPETIELEQMHELIEAKVQKEANRYIHQWPDEKITVENGRWGPYIKFKKKNVKIPKKDDGTRVTSEEAKDYTLEDVKKLIELEIPDAFAKKKKAAAKKKTTTKKTKK